MQTAADLASQYAAALAAHGRGDCALAAQLYRAVVALAPAFAEGHCNLGTALLRLQRPEEAVASYRAALDADPFLDGAHGPLGMALSVLGAHGEAQGHLEIALESDPADADLNFHLAESLNAQGLAEAAFERYEKALAAAPDHELAATAFGGALRSAGKPHRSIAVLRAALERLPDSFQLRFQFAASLLEAERDAEALPILEQLVAQSDQPSVVNNLALAQARSGDGRKAVRTIRALLERLPDYAGGWNTLGMLHFNLGDEHDAARAFEKATECAPDEPDGYVNLAGCLIQRRDRMGALRCLERATVLCGPQPLKLLAIAEQFATLDEVKPSLPLYRRVLELDPANRQAASRLLHLTLASCDWSDYDGLVGQTLARVKAAMAEGRPLPYVIFNLLALPVTHEFVQAAARHQAETIRTEAEAQDPGAPAFVHARRRRPRIRVGYLLPYTYFHSMPLVLQEIARGHDRDDFEVNGYCISRDLGTPFSQGFRAVFDRFRDLAGANRRAAARAIHEDGVDILIDTTGHTPISCLPVMALRPAPVQAHAIGFGLSTGADYIDYLVSDRAFIPPEEKACVREALVYMPDCFLPAFAQPQEADQLGRGFWRLPEDGVVFANFNEPVKFEPRLFDLWMRILKGAPGSVLWLGSWHRVTAEALRREAARRGVDPERIVFAPIVKHHAHTRRLPLADVALDNLSHGGGITTIDALSGGVPVLTLRGATPQTRLGATLCQAARFPDLIVDTVEQYEAAAIALAQDPARRAALRAKLLANRATAPLFDIDRYRHHLESAYRTMWTRWLSGEPPATFDVAPLS